MQLRLSEPAEIALAVAVSGPGLVEEALRIESAGRALTGRELRGQRGTRIHRLSAPAGDLLVEYGALVVSPTPSPEQGSDLELLEAQRPSRYAESDALVDLARSEFAGVAPTSLPAAIGEWVHERLAYELGSSSPTDGALATLDAGRGVCRDFAHVTVALLRALDVPARLAAVYAPQLEPMDFHAVAEAHVDGRWEVVDATRLAPREGLVRIATGRDAADTAFLTNWGSDLELRSLVVDAHRSVRLAADEGAGPVLLA
ncbi:transglutaminase family protein [Schumannella sp. 10F1B-5-1]|uniref:transglutaminase-like domain-containing protein n=1 Tax=Schumannella sp. 10F1B-5-1 TaxID=2590780 RepID=UPI0011313FF0|nr:transglutaminase family protein [Schumannella sp. 10F1B-5-1]TPW70663.1 transglutaminase family protein [Schumannella sp. 10F1B-5-1]